MPTEQVFVSQRLEQVFNNCFKLTENTLLVGGADEPLYQPAGPTQAQHHLYYRDDYFASALHESAHWCIAGVERRLLVDFGYWYAPEGRTQEQQRDFERAEIKPQALEWIFSQACGFPFAVSIDNFNPQLDYTQYVRQFTLTVADQAYQWVEHGLPKRAQIFFDALSYAFNTRKRISELTFELVT